VVRRLTTVDSTYLFSLVPAYSFEIYQNKDKMSTYGPVTSSGTVTSYLPISSRWPSSSECSSLFIDKGPYAINPGLMLYDPEYASVVEHAPTCLPPEAYSMWYPNITHWIDTVPTSTALGGYVMNCPEAYTTYMSTSTDSLITTIGCCPS